MYEAISKCGDATDVEISPAMVNAVKNSHKLYEINQREKKKSISDNQKKVAERRRKIIELKKAVTEKKSKLEEMKSFFLFF